MHSENSKQPLPESLAADRPARDAWRLRDARRMSGAQGWRWLTEAFRLYMKSPGVWTLNFLIYMLTSMALSTVPLVSDVVGAIFLAGFMCGARALEQGRSLEVNHLFAGFHDKGGRLAVVGVAYALGTLAIGALAFGVFAAVAGTGALQLLHGGAQFATQENLVGSELGILLAVLVGVLLYFPLLMAYWFAPALVVFHDVGAVEAMKMSFTGCQRNLWPLTTFSFFGLLLAVLAILPLGLGFLVLGPVLLASVYVSYRDIFVQLD